MNHPALYLVATALYVSATALLWRGLRRGAGIGARLGTLSLALSAVLLHGGLQFADMARGGQLDLGFTHALSLVAWAVALLFLPAAATRPVESLGLLILPVAALALGVSQLWPSHHLLVLGGGPLQAVHIIVSLLAYSLLSVAVLQSLVLALQERRLRGHHPGGLLKSLPPLETMETLMFEMLTAGFLLLTLTLVSGIFFSEAVFGKPLRFTHHILLSILAWAVFGGLLFGHWRYGWRGRTATRWALSGFVLLVLGYFGSKFVLEVILRR